MFVGEIQMRMRNLIIICLGFLMNQSCTDNIVEATQQQEDLAKVTAVDCKGQPNNYTFEVTIESPDLGCEQYADWWEVITRDSVLIYRRILTHSHVEEQPFTRSGGIVDVGAHDFIFVRAHMNNLAYGHQVFSGTPREGLVLDSLDQFYALSLEQINPLPDGCAF